MLFRIHSFPSKILNPSTISSIPFTHLKMKVLRITFGFLCIPTLTSFPKLTSLNNSVIFADCN